MLPDVKVKILYCALQVDSGTASSAAAAAPSSAPAAPGEPLSLVMEEKLAVVLRRDGSLEDKMEVQGSIMLQVRSPHQGVAGLVHACCAVSEGPCATACDLRMLRGGGRERMHAMLP